MRDDYIPNLSAGDLLAICLVRWVHQKTQRGCQSSKWVSDGNLAPREGLWMCRVQRNPQRLQPLDPHRRQPRRQARQLTNARDITSRQPLLAPRRSARLRGPSRTATHAAE